MRNRIICSTAIAIAAVGLIATSVQAKKKHHPTTATTEPTSAPTTASAQTDAAAEQAYTTMIDKRADKIVAALNLDDPAKAASVHDILVTHYRAMRDWQAANQPNNEPLTQVIKDPARQASLAALHDRLDADLAAQLTPQQIEAIKDQLTVNKVRVTYDAYVQIVPNLSDEEKSHILELLKQAREEAIDGRNMAEKSAIFKVYKGKINVYLDKDGHDVSKDYKDWGQAQKAKRQGAATQPAASAQND